jgi:hypothetical protein
VFYNDKYSDINGVPYKKNVNEVHAETSGSNVITSNMAYDTNTHAIIKTNTKIDDPTEIAIPEGD